MTDFNHYFTFTNNVQDLLFKDVTVSSNGGMVGLCFGVAVFTFLYEVIKSLRHYLVVLQMKQRENDMQLSDDEHIRKNGPLFSSLDPSTAKKMQRLKFHCLQTLLHMLQLTMGYMVMLIVMSFNVWLMLSIILTTALCFYFHEYLLSRKSLIVPLEIPGSNL
ncbi:hypothetical protein JTE90_027931 [Oedothorax gibbosus]|uniref:Copper transport protein n=1 Tax=Oedothorax gibbosus TaxID=931172 RepID=A0AAV6VFD1_9ARAC|nr:hypothetical protein JTE90_027931 [Oedothorax gibbosus]